MSNYSGRLSKQQFRDSMGILGLDGFQHISDIIFELLDSQKFGFVRFLILFYVSKISFIDFISYFDIVMNGSQLKKAQLSFNLIDSNKKGYFTKEDFCTIVKTIIEG